MTVPKKIERWLNGTDVEKTWKSLDKDRFINQLIADRNMWKSAVHKIDAWTNALQKRERRSVEDIGTFVTALLADFGDE
jgi:hypothetical protein